MVVICLEDWLELGPIGDGSMDTLQVKRML